MNMAEFKFVDINLSHEDRQALLPKRQSALASGLDLASAHKEPLVLKAHQRVLLSTGVAFSIPAGLEGQVRSRSGLALKHGIAVLNSPGTIDADYRGEIKVILANFSSEDFVITFGMRIAQLVIAPVILHEIMEVTVLGDSSRGADGFGSTGLTHRPL